MKKATKAQIKAQIDACPPSEILTKIEPIIIQIMKDHKVSEAYIHYCLHQYSSIALIEVLGMDGYKEATARIFGLHKKYCEVMEEKKNA